MTARLATHHGKSVEDARANDHDPEDFINPVGLGRAIAAWLGSVALVTACALLGVWLGSK